MRRAARDKRVCADSHLIMVLDKPLEKFPWECLPFLRRKSITRIPSLPFLFEHLDTCLSRTLNPENVCYLLNPAQDLANTQLLFEGHLERYRSINVTEREVAWTGWKGHAPEENYILQELQKRDIFLYFGHGGGEQYLSNHKVQKLPNCAAALLMGCSSGKIHNAGDFDSWGTAVSYLQGGSPAVVATLWDVTDKDLDRFSMRMLESWGLIKGASKSKSLSEAVANSREACVLKYLVGAATVVYGFPVFLTRPNDHAVHLI